MTAEAFEAQYAASSGMTVEELRALGRIVAPCRCGAPVCKGWQSISRATWESDDQYRERHGGANWRWLPSQ